MDEVIFRKSRTLAQTIEDFVSAKKAERYSPWTIDDYMATFSKFQAFAGKTAFEAIDADMVRRFLADQDGISDKTLCNYHTALSSLWTWAVENGFAKEHVVRKIRRPTYVTPRIVPFTETEIHKILRSCRCRRDRAIVMVLLDTGMRAAELTHLEIDDWVDQSLRIRCGKGKKSRIVPVSDPTDKAIHRQLLKRKVGLAGIAGGGALFASNISGNPLRYTALSSLMDRLEKYASVDGVRCHRFRHTFAINFLRNGGDIFTLKRILGHSTLMMVQRYLDIAQSDLARAHAQASPVLNWKIKG
jgi:site-specific recombinase XerD